MPAGVDVTGDCNGAPLLVMVYVVEADKPVKVMVPFDALHCCGLVTLPDAICGVSFTITFMESFKLSQP